MAPEELDLPAQQCLVATLSQHLTDTLGGPVHHLQTHLSHVLLAGGQAWKLHKALATDFADFRRLSQRVHDAQEELRLNRRLAAPLYRDLQAVLGPPGPVRLAPWPAQGALDVAVHMRAFEPDQQWDRLLQRGALSLAMIDRLAGRLVDFQRQAPVAPAWADADERVQQPLRDTLTTLGRLRPDALDGWSDWAAAEGRRLAGWRRQRSAQGCVREGHGDLHLANIAQVDGEPMPFDALAFDPALRWIDVVADLAFLRMDLAAHQRPDLAGRLLDAWLQRNGDGQALVGERAERVARALVRAKVAALRHTQTGQAADRDATDHALALARRVAQPAPPMLLITHGPSGSGKTALTEALLDQGDLVRWRSDVERKRLHGLAPSEASHSPLDGGLNDHTANAATLARLLALADAALQGGHPVLLDATFLRGADRQAARALAARHGVRYGILPFDADPALLRERLARRAAAGHDASEANAAVLARQLQDRDPLDADEQALCWRPDAVLTDAAGAPQARWTTLLAALQSAS
ncbi:AAA family ATPase [Ideonella sp. 4Y11]|uniref:AAA family ATPase n=1 Tax=Ideonella aquatica TaxID=2824119 RepID=A0A941BKQ6_9BURK|nr:bifunctional aminoglycoside phosphotransferase/ATP-binding protein [Ideonella aquatica]MBQ0958859.1 AAA family ATPase [Ideonella aquatica]